MNKVMRDALQSIANSACCSGCQQAALVAKKALGSIETTTHKDEWEVEREWVDQFGVRRATLKRRWLYDDERCRATNSDTSRCHRRAGHEGVHIWTLSHPWSLEAADYMTVLTDDVILDICVRDAMTAGDIAVSRRRLLQVLAAWPVATYGA